MPRAAKFVGVGGAKPVGTAAPVESGCIDIYRVYRLERKETLVHETGKESVRSYLGALRLLVAALSLGLGALVAEDSARSLGRRAAKAEKAGHVAEAILLYNQASAKNPRNPSFAAKSRSLTEKALRQKLAPATIQETPFAPVANSLILDKDLREAESFRPPPELALSPGPFSFRLRGEPREVIEKAARDLGIDVQFDNDFPTGAAAIHFELAGASGVESLEALGAATGTFFVALQPKRMMVAKDTGQKRQELEPTVAVVLSLPEPASVQELQELGRAVQQTMELQKFSIDNGRRLVLIRDKISKVRPAQQMFEQMMGARPAVAIEIEVYELRRNRTLAAGLRLPTSTELFALARNPITGTDIRIPALPLSSARIGTPQLGITLGDAQLLANLLNTLGSRVQRAEIRTMHGMPAQFAVGERYPILTAGFFGGEPTNGGTAYRPPPTFQFENLGLTLKATPYTHSINEMTVEIEAEFKVLTGAQINGIPILANRKFNSTVRLTNGEWAMMAGVGSSSQTLTKAGPAGLIQIPWIGALFRRNAVELDESETIVMLRPRALALPPSEVVTHAIRLGSETHPRIPH